MDSLEQLHIILAGTSRGDGDNWQDFFEIIVTDSMSHCFVPVWLLIQTWRLAPRIQTGAHQLVVSSWQWYARSPQDLSQTDDIATDQATYILMQCSAKHPFLITLPRCHRRELQLSPHHTKAYELENCKSYCVSAPGAYHAKCYGMHLLDPVSSAITASI